MTGLGSSNEQVQQLKRLLGRRRERYAARRFVVEGPLLSAEAVRAGWECVAQYIPVASGAAVEGAGPVSELASGVFERVATTQTPQPPLTLVSMPERDRAGVLAAASLVVVLHGVSDPGNLGTILRSAEAAGVDVVVLTPGSVDPYSPKVVRSSAGSLFHVPVIEAELADVAAAGFELVGTTSHDIDRRSVVVHTDAALGGRVAIVVGNEAAGLDDRWDDDHGPIDTWITIPHRGRTESLNVAMATTVLVFEAARQRSGEM